MRNRLVVLVSLVWLMGLVGLVGFSFVKIKKNPLWYIFFVSVHVPDTSEGSFAILVMFIPLSSSSILYIRCISCLASAQDQTKPFSNGWKFPPSLSQTYQFVWGNQTCIWFMLRITKSMSKVLPRQLALWHRTRNRHRPCLSDEWGRQPTIRWGTSLYI